MDENTHLPPEYKARLEASFPIEADALTSTPDTPASPVPHVHEEMKSFIATPRMDQPLLQKMLGWVRGDLPPGTPIVHKSAGGLRYILSITSNSYEDREKETMTSAALKAYEDSCFPGEGLYHNDNPYVWWHDDDVPMGRIVAVNYSEPFLVEFIEEIEGDIVSKVLFDFAEKNGHKAGASHRFGYHETDRTPNGDYLHIYKQESTFLPDRSLAANGLTYAGVINDMASQQSNEWLDRIFKEATGIDNVSAVLHDKSRDHAQKLAEIKGLMHKAAKPPTLEADAVKSVGGDVEGATGEVKAPAPADIPGFMNFMNQMYTVFMSMVDGQMGLMDAQTEMMKVFDETRTAEKAKTQSLEQATADQDARLKEAAAQIEAIQKHLSLAPRSVQTQPGEAAEAVKTAVDQAQKVRDDDNFEEVPGWGKLKKLS
jgi:hypothetical protein